MKQEVNHFGSGNISYHGFVTLNMRDNHINIPQIHAILLKLIMAFILNRNID
jgi:hypothetical protein